MSSATFTKAAVTACSASDTSFCWHGGSVQHDPKVYLVFWGSLWNTDMESIAVKNKVTTLFQYLAGGNYNNILHQYYDGSGLINNDTVLAGSGTDVTHPVPSEVSMENADVSYSVVAEAMQVL
jgi:hypothetical protein